MGPEYFFEVGNTIRHKFIACRYEIRWNIHEITGNLNAEGYIVQRFSRTAIPSLSFLPDKSYFEAWQVTNGKCDRNRLFDDGYAVAIYPSDRTQCPEELVDAVVRSVGTAGRIEFRGDVFWIPRGDVLYSAISEWPTGIVEEAGDLPAVEDFPELDDAEPRFQHNFTHKWDFTSEPLIVETAADIFENAFPQRVREANLIMHIKQMDISESAKNALADKLCISNWNA